MDEAGLACPDIDDGTRRSRRHHNPLALRPWRQRAEARPPRVSLLGERPLLEDPFDGRGIERPAGQKQAAGSRGRGHDAHVDGVAARERRRPTDRKLVCGDKPVYGLAGATAPSARDAALDKHAAGADPQHRGTELGAGRQLFEAVRAVRRGSLPRALRQLQLLWWSWRPHELDAQASGGRLRVDDTDVERPTQRGLPIHEQRMLERKVELRIDRLAPTLAQVAVDRDAQEELVAMTRDDLSGQHITELQRGERMRRRSKRRRRHEEADQGARAQPRHDCAAFPARTAHTISRVAASSTRASE